MRRNEPAEIFRTRPMLLALCTELAVGFLEEKEALDLYNVTEAEYVVLKKNPAFKRVLEAERAKWATPLNTEARTQLKAQYLVEQLLPEINARIFDRTEDLDKVVKAGQWLSKLAGFDSGVTGTDPREKFIIQINMGAPEAEVNTSFAIPPAPPKEVLDKAPEFCLVETVQPAIEDKHETIQIETGTCYTVEGVDRAPEPAG